MTRTVLLGDIAKVVKGISYRSLDYSEKGEGLAFINLKNVGRGGGFRTDGTKYYKGEYKPDQTVLPGDILVANTDLTQDRDIIGSPLFMPDLGENACFSLDLSKLEIREPDLIDKNYLFYLLKTPQARHYMISHSNGSTVMHLSISSIPKMKLNLPDIAAQKAVAGFLHAIDEKIELNRKINKTLEQMGQALFKHYFITNPKVENWEDINVKDILQIRNGFAFKSRDYIESGIPIVRTTNFTNDNTIVLDDVVYISENDSRKFSSFQLAEGDLLVVMVGASLGKMVLVPSSILPALQNQNMWCFRAHSAKYKNYISYKMRQLILSNISSGSGSAREFFRKDYFYGLKLRMPDTETLEEFNSLIDPLLKMIDSYFEEIQTLATLRDTLLPRLISGKAKYDQ